MAKADKEPAVEPAPAPVADPVTGCVVCGSYTGTFVTVAGAARVHEVCAENRPDVVAKVKARA